MRRAEPAALVWAALIGEALVADVVLVARGRRSLTSVHGCRAGWVLHLYLLLHFARRLGRLDAFNAAARRFTKEIA